MKEGCICSLRVQRMNNYVALLGLLDWTSLLYNIESLKQTQKSQSFSEIRYALMSRLSVLISSRKPLSLYPRVKPQRDPSSGWNGSHFLQPIPRHSLYRCCRRTRVHFSPRSAFFKLLRAVGRLPSARLSSVEPGSCRTSSSVTKATSWPFATLFVVRTFGGLTWLLIFSRRRGPR